MDVGRALDRLLGTVAPRTALRRLQAREALAMAVRHYEAAGHTRRTAGWRAPASSQNRAVDYALGVLRDRSRDLVRNNPWAGNAIELYESEVVGSGIVPKWIVTLPGGRPGRAEAVAARLAELWADHAETTSIDADARLDFYGMQSLAVRTIFESGEVLARRRRRRPSDGLPLPFQLELLEPDHLDSSRDRAVLENGGKIRQGIQVDPIGRREGYWLFPEDPNELFGLWRISTLVPASEVLHAYRMLRAKQLRGVPALAPVLLKLRDLDEYEDAELLKQKIAACMAGFVSDSVEGEVTTGLNKPLQLPETLEPGALVQLGGKTITFSDPPSVASYEPFVRGNLRGVAAGVHLTYEAVSGDWSGVNYSSARMGHLQNGRTVERFRWNVVACQFLNPLAAWFVEAAMLTGDVPLDAQVKCRWTPPRRAMVDPKNEVPARRDAIRAGFTSLSETIREDGGDPEEVAAELAADLERMRQLGIPVESDPRVPIRTGEQSPAAGAAPAP